MHTFGGMKTNPFTILMSLGFGVLVLSGCQDIWAVKRLCEIAERLPPHGIPRGIGTETTSYVDGYDVEDHEDFTQDVDAFDSIESEEPSSWENGEGGVCIECYDLGEACYDNFKKCEKLFKQYQDEHPGELEDIPLCPADCRACAEDRAE